MTGSRCRLTGRAGQAVAGVKELYLENRIPDVCIPAAQVPERADEALGQHGPTARELAVVWIMTEAADRISTNANLIPVCGLMIGDA